MKSGLTVPDGFPPARRPTIREVAETAGVSRSTASRALTGRGYVAPAVRDRVREVARSLGYVPDATARHLRQQASQSIGVLVSDLNNPFYAGLAAGISQQARKRQYTMMLADDGGSPEVEAEAAEAFVALRVAGVIVTPVSAEISTYLARQRIPVVEVDRQFSLGACDAVMVDNSSAARQVTSQLLDLGHRRIAMVIDEMHWTTGRDRLAGYRAAFAAAGVPFDDSLVVSAGWDVDAARIEAHKLLSRPEPPTAVFAANNVLAEAVWRAATELNLTIPDQLSLVSFDDVSWMSLVQPGVTAVAQDPVALGEAAISQLFERIQSPHAPVRTVLLSATVTSRGSTAPPRTR
ncbi:LacI family DNA-binding transcriptional regulator [Micromonospora sp. DT46]|uniref:LacI family DNA-binding transcriptional regulator n=1 Tax=unclassified Micromonospora TaxID=2617518 RepID=UPI00124AF123|nr:MULTISPECIES: LacI family DNA-binding transcriptional regulator [unclassified Micromonospora]KAB1132633.1 LacI family transcriptional regulator [Micromonospora sp. AMSO12t]WSF99819.1 LacI family transcriptional regulator [Micromonospora sp. NBC_01740]